MLDRSHLTKVEFAQKINLTRDGVYKIFDKESIDADQLQKISVVLSHDFFSYYQGELRYANERNSAYGAASKENVDNLNRDVQNLTRIVNSLVNKIEGLESAIKYKPARRTKKV